METAVGVLFETLKSAQFGAPMVFDNLTVFPFVAVKDRPPAYLRFAEAAETGFFQVTEISAHGSVPELAVNNRLAVPVLMLDGDELVGAKQNRVLNLTVLVPAESKITVPVSCVEQGRWRSESPAFSDGKETLFAAARAAKMAQVNRALSEGRGRRSEQHVVWEAIAAKQERMRAPSSTGAVDSVYAQHRPALERFEGAFKARPGEVGSVFAIDGRPLGCELFDASKTYEAYLPRLVRSYALDAIDVEQPVSAIPSRQALDSFIGGILGAGTAVYPAVGLGEELRLQGLGITGAALVTGGTIVHFCVFGTQARRRRSTRFHGAVH
jgi:hypothetical protein